MRVFQLHVLYSFQLFEPLSMQRTWILLALGSSFLRKRIKPTISPFELQTLLIINKYITILNRGFFKFILILSIWLYLCLLLFGIANMINISTFYLLNCCGKMSNGSRIRTQSFFNGFFKC